MRPLGLAGQRPLQARRALVSLASPIAEWPVKNRCVSAPHDDMRQRRRESHGWRGLARSGRVVGPREGDVRTTLWFLSTCGRASPYPFLETIGTIVYLVCMTVGLYFLVNYLDRNVERTHLKKGYQLLVGSLATLTSYAVLNLASIDFGYLLINSAAVMLFQKAVLSILAPALKNCFGNDDRKLWSYAMPAYILGLELGQCVLFLSSNPTNEFWSLAMFQEFNSVLKNTGKYDELYAVVRSRVGRPLDESARKRTEEKRAIIAPCDNVGEIMSPVVLIVAIGLEALYSSFGFERAPYLADSGILEAWRMDEVGQGRP